MDNFKVTESEIIERLNDIALGKKIKLTYTNKLFFLNLLEIANIYGFKTQDGLEIELSNNQLAACMNISPSIVSQSIRKLKKCGVIIRKTGRKSFSPYITIIKNDWIKNQNLK